MKRVVKSAMSLLLAAGVVVSVLPATVQAEEPAASNLSVSAYATKEQMMEVHSGIYNDGWDDYPIVNSIGTISFGKNDHGEAQAWYILGKDDGVEGDNTTLFAAHPILSSMTGVDVFPSFGFSYSTSNKELKDETVVYSGTRPDTVYANHYGESELRDRMQWMATNTSLFTTAEQALMNATTVSTPDRKNSVSYTTTDVLYALSGYSGDVMVSAGSRDQFSLMLTTFWTDDKYSPYDRPFWLRTGYSGRADRALATVKYSATKREVTLKTVTTGYANQPATNIQLPDGVYASAAVTAADASVDNEALESIASGTTMTLRWPASSEDSGTSVDVGSAVVDAAAGTVQVTPGSVTLDVQVVIQGNDGTNDWYYRQKITGSEIINVSNLTGSYTPASIDLATCKVWLETTDPDTGLTYAVDATEPGAVPATHGGHHCSHVYEWEVYQKATATTDGIMRYRCKVCGTVEYEVPVTAYYVFNKETQEAIWQAAPNATVKAETPIFISFHEMVKEALVARPDVTLVVDYKNVGKSYEMTIPAGSGAQLETLFGDSKFAGFLYLGGAFATVEQ